MKYLFFFLPLALLFSCGDNNKTESLEAPNLDSLLVLFPDSVPLLIERGNLSLTTYDFDKALADGAKAFRLDSNRIEARMLFADVLNNRPGRTVEEVAIAQKHFMYIHKRDPKNTKALVSIASTYTQQEDYEKSFQYINEALRIDPKYRDAYVLKGTNYVKLNQLDLAKSSYETAVQQDPKFFEAYIVLGSMYQGEKNKICLEYYKTAAELQPQNTDVLYSLAYGYQQFEQIPEAQATYRQMIEQDTTYAPALFQLGYIKQWLQKTPDIDSAMYFYSSAIETDPTYVEAWHNLGICYMNRGDNTNALTSFSKALKYNPNFTLSRDLVKKISK